MRLPRLLVFVLIICCLFACQETEKEPTPTREELIQEKLAKKIQSWNETMDKKCRENVLQAAADLVDSLLILQARADRDFIARPEKPFKPEKPSIKLPTDSLPVAPILKDTLPIDSLGKL